MSLQEYRELMARAAEPLKERLTEIDTELNALRAEKTEIESILRKTDQLPAKPKKVEQPKGQVVTREEIASVWAWLRTAELNGDGFHATMLKENADFRQRVTIRSGVLVQALAALHERGNLTLDRRGQGGSRIYKVVT